MVLGDSLVKGAGCWGIEQRFGVMAEWAQSVGDGS